ncbi:MAG TPA: V-type ATP synthase subunit D [Gammaproteobacteria bacterium]|jgi:V/A-type H+-transporting ATPase subunit D|nr:V-type ATP synthase subunit D [Gammaproteobacteria bacterium]
MARLALNKSTLSKQTRQLKSYREFLPSLDMKRRQLMAERNQARQALQRLERDFAGIDPLIAEHLPMLSNERVELTDLVRVVGVDIVEENVMGTRLPLLNNVHVQVRDYSLLTKPHWVDRLAEYLMQALEQRIAIQVAQQRLALLEQAVLIITQRVNLFDKVLIPRTQKTIKKIRISLSDAERDAVIRAKLAKSKKRQLS